MATTLFSLPFNGNAQSSGATPVTAAVTGGEFVTGKTQAQALYFSSEGKAEVTPQVIPLSGTYTLTFWVKVKQQPTGPTDSWMLVKFGGDNRFLYLDFNSTLTSWSYITIVQETDRVSAYVNGTKTATELFPAGWGKPVGLAVLNDSQAPSGYMTIEEVTVYAETVLPDMPTPTPIPMSTVNYFINGVNFVTCGVYVSASSGLLDNVSMKEPVAAEWPDYHGQIIDLTRPLYQPRVITLSCFIKAESPDVFMERLLLFLAQFNRPHTQRLKLTVLSKPLVYDVYLRDSINLKKQWSNSGMVGTFELQLIEPEPIKRVLQHPGAGTASITMTTRKAVTIHWGDKTHAFDVWGEPITVTHTYATPGPFEIIIAGVIEDITGFTSNADVLWSKL